MSTLHNTYLFKAMDSYPYDLEGTIEALQYALSYDDENPLAYVLLGKVHCEQLHDFQTAKEYFEKALELDIYCLQAYPDFIALLIKMEEFGQAEKLIHFAMGIKGMNKGEILYQKSILYEVKGELKLALKELKKAKRLCFTYDFLQTVEYATKRVKDKLPKKKKCKRKKKSKSK